MVLVLPMVPLSALHLQRLDHLARPKRLVNGRSLSKVPPSGNKCCLAWSSLARKLPSSPENGKTLVDGVRHLI